MKKQKIVIIGAGFAGLTCARELMKHYESNSDFPLSITIVDKNSYQLFSPLLYQVATGGLPEDDIAYPIRAAVPGTTFHRGEVTNINPKKQVVSFADGKTLSYDYLVLATGSTGSDFGIPGVNEYSLQMKTMSEAREIRRRLLQTYEDVEMGIAPKEALQVVVVGGGPTGVELAGAIAELQKGMQREYSDIESHANVSLVEAGPRVLPTFSPESSKHAQEALRELGVEVYLDSPVERLHDGSVRLKSGNVLYAGTIIWAAGIAAYEEWSFLGKTDKTKRLQVDEYLKIRDNIWVIGDSASFSLDGIESLPTVAPVAIQMGKHTAKQIVNTIIDKPLEPFRYKDKGQMATIGRRRAVVELPNGIKLHGTLAWLIWLALHIFYLAGGRNRISVIADWMWNYLAWTSGPRRTVVD